MGPGCGCSMRGGKVEHEAAIGSVDSRWMSHIQRFDESEVVDVIVRRKRQISILT